MLNHQSVLSSLCIMKDRDEDEARHLFGRKRGYISAASFVWLDKSPYRLNVGAPKTVGIAF